MLFQAMSKVTLLGVGSAAWGLLHLLGAECDTAIIKKLGGREKGGRRNYAMLYGLLSTIMYTGLAYLYSSTFRDLPAHKAAGSWPKALPNMLAHMKPGMREAVAVAASIARFASVFLAILNILAPVTPPGTKLQLKHDGFHATEDPKGETRPQAPEEVSAYGLGRIMRHPINIALAIFALSHLTPSDNYTRWLASFLFWAPQLAMAVVGARAHDRRLARDPSPTYKRFLAESPPFPNLLALRRMPRDELMALLRSVAVACGPTAVFWFSPKFNRLLYAPHSAWLPLGYMALEAAYRTPAPSAMLPFKEGKKVEENESARGDADAPAAPSAPSH